MEYPFDGKIVRLVNTCVYGNPGERRVLRKGTLALAQAATNMPEDSPIHYWLRPVSACPEDTRRWAEDVGCGVHSDEIEDNDDTINRVAAGEEIPGVTIYFDKQDPQNPGPAYRIDGGDSGSLEFSRWSEGSTEGYYLADYFDGDGRYLGPDRHGVHPVFSFA